MAYWDSEFQRVRSPILRYGFAVASVVIATAVALVIQEYQFRDVELPLLALVIGLVTWYTGTGPAVVAVLLSTAVFSYLFVEPIYSFYVSARELPYFLCSRRSSLPPSALFDVASRTISATHAIGFKSSSNSVSSATPKSASSTRS